MVPQKVEGGIYIDHGCNGIVKIERGVFIPTSFRSHLDDDTFQLELEEFLAKWFKPCEQYLSSNKD